MDGEFGESYPQEGGWVLIIVTNENKGFLYFVDYLARPRLECTWISRQRRTANRSDGDGTSQFGQQDSGGGEICRETL